MSSRNDAGPVAEGDASPGGRAARREPVRLSDAERRVWSEFGSTATDSQRINLRLGRAPGQAVFLNAGQVMGGRVQAIAERGGLALTQQFAESLQAAAGAFVEAADSIVDVHRTRLYLDPHAGTGARENGVILEWRDGAEPTLESVPLDDFREGRWAGLMRSTDPRYSAAIGTLMRQAAALSALLVSAAGEFETAQLSIRTFDPVTGEAAAVDAHPWIAPVT